MANKLIGDLVTFSRGTGATRVNSAGLIVGVDFSTTSNTITTGSKTFTITADANVNRDWAVNSSVIAVAQAGATGSMTGVVTSYTPSTQSLVINVTSVTGSGTSTDWRIGSLEMREDYDPVTLVRKGVLSEGAVTNYLKFSKAFDNAAWTKNNGATVTPSSGISPDGSNNATKLNAVVGVRSSIFQDVPQIALNTVLTVSFFAKKAEHRYVYVASGGVGFSANGQNDLLTIFDLELGVISATVLPLDRVKIESYGNGWYRISVALLSDNDGGSYSPLLEISQSGTSIVAPTVAGGVLIYEASFVQSLNPTSTIPTTTTQVTRNADNFPLTASAVASIRQGEGTIYAEITCDDTGVAQKRALRLSGTNADIRIGKQGTGTLSNFTKMAEGAGLRLMGTATSLIRGNGQDLVGVTAVNDRTNLPEAIPGVNSADFNGVGVFGLASSSTGGGRNEEVFINSTLGTFSGKGTGAADLSGAHYNGSRFIVVSQGNTGVVFVSDGTSYRRINTPVINQIAFEVTSGLVGGTLRNVIVGNGGFIATSDDNGETWTARTSGTTQSLNGASFGSVGGTNYFIAAGNGSQLRYSTDAITYTNATGLGTNAFSDVHIANGISVATSLNNGAIYVSTNGTAYTAATATNTTQSLNGVTYSPTLNLWIAVGNGGTVITATDPAGTWTVQTSGTTQTLTEAGIFNNAIYIVGGGSTLLTSTNGTSYTSLSANASSTLRGIAASPTTVLISGSNGTLSSSTDGATFTSRTNVNSTINGMAFGNGTFVSVGNVANGSGSGYIATIGADGTVTRRVSGTTAGITGLKFLNGRFVGNSSAATTGVTSVNGDTWSSVNFTTSNNSIAFGNGIYIANRSGTVSGNTVFIVSTDLATFTTPQFSLAGADLSDIEFANGLFVAVGAAGAIVTITNSGTTLTPVRRTSNTTQNLNSVMFSTRDSLWYAAGNGGVLLYSPDAITWTAVQNSGTASILGTTLQSNQPLPQFKSGVNKIALSYKQNQVIAALNGVASTSDTAATIPTITAASIAENLNGYINNVQIFPVALTNAELTAKTL